MKKLLGSKFIILLATITLVIVLVSLFYKPTPVAPKVVNTFPAQNSTKVNYFDQIQINFDRVVDPALISVSSNPPEDWTVTAAGPNSIILAHRQYFRVDTQYTVDISYNNQPLYTLSFETAHQQNDPRYVQEVVNEMKRDYPLATLFPYETSAYTVAYVSPLSLEISPKNNLLSSSEMIEQVRAFVSQNGVDPNSHEYTVVSPPPIPTPSPNL